MCDRDQFVNVLRATPAAIFILQPKTGLQRVRAHVPIDGGLLNVGFGKTFTQADIHTNSLSEPEYVLNLHCRILVTIMITVINLNNIRPVTGACQGSI